MPISTRAKRTTATARKPEGSQRAVAIAGVTSQRVNSAASPSTRPNHIRAL
jgi:hypothetical protein